MVAVVRDKAQAAGLLQFRAVACAAEDLRVPAGSFDLVAIGNAFHRLPRDAVAASAFRWLRPGGFLALAWGGSPHEGEAPWQRALRQAMDRWKTRVQAHGRVPAEYEQDRRDARISSSSGMRGSRPQAVTSSPWSTTGPLRPWPATRCPPRCSRRWRWAARPRSSPPACAANWSPSSRTGDSGRPSSSPTTSLAARPEPLTRLRDGGGEGGHRAELPVRRHRRRAAAGWHPSRPGRGGGGSRPWAGPARWAGTWSWNRLCATCSRSPGPTPSRAVSLASASKFRGDGLYEPTSCAVMTLVNVDAEPGVRAGERGPVDVGQDDQLVAPAQNGQRVVRVGERGPVRHRAGQAGRVAVGDLGAELARRATACCGPARPGTDRPGGPPRPPPRRRNTRSAAPRRSGPARAPGPTG